MRYDGTAEQIGTKINIVKDVNLEYPEFAWLEGIVNVVTHREYGMTGSYIKISMFDDRLDHVFPKF